MQTNGGFRSADASENLMHARVVGNEKESLAVDFRG
jgi:hypothetical protein